MFGGFYKKVTAFMTALASIVCLGVPAFAQIPNTGDGSGMMLPIVGGLLGISVVLIIVYVVLSKKKK